MEIKPQDIKDFLHLYIGCDVNNGIETGKLVGVTESEYERGKTVALIDFGAGNFIEWYAEDCKPILRKLSDMTEEEKERFIKQDIPNARNWEISFEPVIIEVWHGDKHSIQDNYSPENVRFLLKEGFDLFNLIDAGLAIDKTSLKK